MAKRFTVALVCVLIVANMGVGLASQGVTGLAKTMSEINKNQQVPVNIDEMKITFKDQVILMTYIRAIDKSMMVMSMDQMKQLARTYLVHQYSPQVSLETIEQIVTSIDKMMLFMTYDQLASMLDKMISMLTKDQLNLMIKDNNIAVTMSGLSRFNILQQAGADM